MTNGGEAGSIGFGVERVVAGDDEHGRGPSRTGTAVEGVAGRCFQERRGVGVIEGNGRRGVLQRP